MREYGRHAATRESAAGIAFAAARPAHAAAAANWASAAGSVLTLRLFALAAGALLAIPVALFGFGPTRLGMAIAHPLMVSGGTATHANAGNSVGTASGLIFIGLGFIYLFVSLALPHAPRHRRRPPSPASPGAAGFRGVPAPRVELPAAVRRLGPRR